MMSSTWKISVFGIVALMLAFGLTAGDALAHSSGHSSHPRTNVRHFADSGITVAVNSTTGEGGTGGAADRSGDNLFNLDDSLKLRATEKLDSLVFTYDHGSAEKKGTVTLTIPRTWTRAVRDNNDGVDEPGEITVSGANSYSVTSGGGGWQVKANLTDDPPYATTTITYKKIEVPNRAGRYEFGISSTTVGDGHTVTINPHSDGHAIAADDPDDPPAGYHKHSGDSSNVISIEVAAHAHPGELTHGHNVDNDHVITVAGHDHAADHSHGHNDDGSVVDVAGHAHPHAADIGQHRHDGMTTGIHSHPTDGTDANSATHAHGTDASETILVAGNHATHAGSNTAGIDTHSHDDDGTVKDVSLGHRHTNQDGGTGDHEHGADGVVSRVGGTEADGHATIHATADNGHGEGANHTHDANGTVSAPSHSHAANQDGDTGNHQHDAIDRGAITAVLVSAHVSNGHGTTANHHHDSNGTVASPGAGHKHTNVNAGDQTHSHSAAVDFHAHPTDTTHTHDNNGTVKNVLRRRYVVNNVAVMGHTHTTEGGAGYTNSHDHETGEIPVHATHNPQILRNNGITRHTHGGANNVIIPGDETGPIRLHTHTSGNSGQVVIDTPHIHAGAPAEAITVTTVPHTHDTNDVDDDDDRTEVARFVAHTHDSTATEAVDIGVAAHTHVADGSITSVTAHNHAGGTMSVTVTAHMHEDDGTTISPVTVHTHDSNGTVLIGIVAHTHNAGGTLVEFTGHLHINAPDHQHEVDGFSVIPFDLHTHASNRRVNVVRAHTHTSGAPTHSFTGVDQTMPHFHGVEHNGRYAIYVGSVLSGAGTVTLTNTSSPKLAKRGADPYKNLYLATKGQALGNVRVQFEAAGTMVKGAGIMIQLPDYADSPFPQFYPDNPSGPAGGVSLADSRSKSLAQFSAFPDSGDADGYTTNALYLTTKSGLEKGNRITVNIRGVTLKAHGDAPDKDPTGGVGSVTISTSTASPLVSPDDDNPIVTSDLVGITAGSPMIRITAPHGSGKIVLDARDPLDALTQAGGDEGLGNVVIAYTADGGALGTGSKVEITIPGAFAAVPFEPASDADNRSGAVTLSGPANLTVAGRVLTADLTGELAHGEQLIFIYKAVKAPAAEGVYTFRARASSGPHGALTMLADDEQKSLEVTGAHGSGTISLTRGGSTFRMAAKDQQLGNLRFTYTAGSRMSKEAKVQITIPEGWTSPHLDNGDGISTAGEVKLTGKANLEITGRPWKLTATTTDVLLKGEKLVFDYKSVKAPATAGSYTFITNAIAYSGATTLDDAGARLDSSPTVGIDQAPDGSGTLSVSKSTTPALLTKDATGAYLVKAGESLGDLTFTYTATGKMEIGSSVEITIPGSSDDWPQPSVDNGDGITEAGESSVGGAGQAGLVISDRTLIATITVELQSGNTFTITYKGINAPTTVGEHDFTTQSKSTPGGVLTNLTAGSPTIKVGEVPVGVVSISTMDADGMSTPLTAAGPGIALGDVTIMYTATARITTGAKVMVTVPAGWTTPNIDNNDGVDGAGEVSLVGSGSLSVTGGGGQPWQLVATTSAVVASGDTLVFTYKNVTAPSTEGSYTFTTVASISAASIPVPIAAQPTPIIVRAMVTAIAIEADDSFFAGESLSGMVTLWAGTGAANALGDMVVTLSSDSETGSFAADSVTIADNMNGVAFTYNDTAPGMVTLTATSGEITGTKEVTVKSGVAGLSVTPDLVKAGSDVTVTATGKAGGGTVQVMDSDGMQVGATKSLDPVIEPEEGDVTYSRTITLPATLADGTYTVTVDIQDLTDSMDIEVLNDQAPPALSGATAQPMTVMNGDLVTLSVMATSTIDITSVKADLSAVDSTQTEMVSLTQQGDGGTYFYVFTISDMNTAEDGEAMITFTATDRIKNAGTAMVSVTLDNVADEELTRVWVEPTTPYKPGQTAWIKAMGSEGGSPTATVNDSESGMAISGELALKEMEDTPGTYVVGFPIVPDTQGVYNVTVTLGTQIMMSENMLTIVPPGYEFTLDIPMGRSMIHIPLDVSQVNGVDMEINTVRDVFNALGDAVSIITTLADDGVTFNSYLGDDVPGSAFGDTAIGDDTGLMVNMSSAMTLALKGDALGSGGAAAMNLRMGLNLVGVPLQTGVLPTLSAAINHPIFAGITHIVIMDENGEFQNVVAGTATDGPLMGGRGYLVITSAAFALPVSGVAWENDGGSSSSAAPVVLNPSTTSVLHVQGRLIDEVGMMSLDGLNVSVRNLTRGVVLGSTVATDDYSMTFVKLDSSAAKVGDVLEIRADSPNPLLGIRPVQHVVTSEDVLNGSIGLADLVTYEIPALTELLANYPNPFNPETWVPFRLAEDANVSLTIYGASGSLVRTIDIGFTPAAVYQGRSDAIYWDGRNDFGEQVSSGIYFYHLNAGDFSATRKMVIVK